MLCRLKIPYKRSRLDFKRTRVRPCGNSRGEVVPFQLGVGWGRAALSDAPLVDEQQGASQGLISYDNKVSPLKMDSKAEGVRASVCFRMSDPARMTVPVGSVMALKPPQQSWYIPADKRGDDSAGRPLPFSGASLRSERLIKGT